MIVYNPGVRIFRAATSDGDASMKLSKQTSDAVNILLYCKQSDGDLVKVGLIADELDLTKQMALKLSNRLSRAELLATVRGPKGGVQLTELAGELPLGKIVRRLEIVLHGAEGDPEPNPFDLYFDEAFEAFLDVLDQHTLADLAAGKSRKRKSPPAASKRKKRVAPGARDDTRLAARTSQRAEAGRRDRA